MLDRAKQIKYLFFDVDSTLYDHSLHDFPSSTKVTLEALGQKGYELFIATSRSEQELRNVMDLIEQFPFRGMITCGGALTRLDGEIVDTVYIDKQQAERIMMYCRDEQIDVRWQGIKDSFFDRPVQPETAEIFSYLYQLEHDVNQWQGEELINMLCFANSAQRKVIRSLASTSSLVDYGSSLEVTGYDVNKATAIGKLGERLGFTMAEVAAFGDGHNDVRMIQSAGIGVAMGNGVEDVKQVADLVTNDIKDDGIAYACGLLGFLDEGVVG